MEVGDAVIFSNDYDWFSGKTGLVVKVVHKNPRIIFFEFLMDGKIQHLSNRSIALSMPGVVIIKSEVA